MKKSKKEEYADISRNVSTDPVDEAIFRILSSGPVLAGSLEKEVVHSTGFSRTKYDQRRKALLMKGEIVNHRPKGRRNVYYALPKDKERLYQYDKGGNMQHQVIEDGRYLRDYMMRDADYDSEGYYLSMNVHVRFDFFRDEVDRLRKTNPNLPEWHCEELTKPERQRDDAEIMRVEFSYVLNVLEALKAL